MTVKRDIFPCDDGERQFSYDGEDSDCFHVMMVRDSFPCDDGERQFPIGQ